MITNSTNKNINRILQNSILQCLISKQQIFSFSFAIQIKLYWCLIYGNVSSIEKVCCNFSKNFILTWRFVLCVWIIQPFALVLSYLWWKQGYKIGNTDIIKFDFGIVWNTPETAIFVASIRKNSEYLILSNLDLIHICNYN